MKHLVHEHVEWNLTVEDKLLEIINLNSIVHFTHALLDNKNVQSELWTIKCE